MLDTFKIASSINRTYEKNNIVHWLKTLPFVGKLIPYAAYGNMGVRVIANIFYFMKKVAGFCISEIIYVLALIGASFALESMEIGVDSTGIAAVNVFSKAECFQHIFFFGMLIGIVLNSTIFDATEDKYYSIILLKLNAKKTVLSGFIYKLIRKFIGYMVMAAPVVLITTRLSFVTYLALVITTLFGKFIGAWIKLQFVKKDKIQKHSLFGFIFASVVVAAAIALFAMNIVIPTIIIYIFAAVVVLFGSFCIYKLWKYDDYRQLCQYFLKEDVVFARQSAKEKTASNEQKAASNALSKVEADITKTSTKSGYAFFNDIFFARHSKLLKSRTRLLCIVLLAIIAIETAVLAYFRTIDSDGFGFNMSMFLFCAPFIIYFINTGESVTSAMFINCDSAMLTYNFYRTPATILGVFKQRLIMLIKLNLLPSVLVATIIAIANFFSGEPTSAIDYVSLYFTLIALSVFFSVHRLVIYYLLQPYTEGLVKKSSSYSIVNFITYFVSYMLFTMREDLVSEPSTFVIVTGIFSIVYIVIALILVYKLAPKKFKIRRG